MTISLALMVVHGPLKPESEENPAMSMPRSPDPPNRRTFLNAGNRVVAHSSTPLLRKEGPNAQAFRNRRTRLDVLRCRTRRGWLRNNLVKIVIRNDRHRSVTESASCMTNLIRRISYLL